MINADKELTDNGHKQADQTSLHLLSLMMNNIPQAVFWKDQNLVYLGCNQAFVEDAGFSSPEEIIGKTDFDMPWKDQAELYRADDRRILDSGEPKLNYEEPQTTPNGSTIWLRTSKIPVHENGQTVAILGMYEDVTKQKQTEAFLRSMTENAPEAVGIIDLTTGLFTDPNENALKLYDMSREELVKVGPADMSPTLQPDGSASAEKAMEQIKLAMQGETPVFEWVHRNAQGKEIPCEVRLMRLPGDLPRVRFSVTDITTRKRAEEVVENERQRFQTILETVRVPTIISRLSDGIVLYANQAIAQVSQVHLEKLIGFKTGNFYANPDDQTKIREALRDSGHIEDFEVQFRRTDGSLYWALLSSRIINYEGETCVLSTYVDITERKQAEEALHENEERFRRFTEATVEGLIFHERGTVIDVNPAAVTMIGSLDVKDLIGKNLLEFIVPEFHQLVLEKMQSHTVLPYEIQCIRTDGSIFPVETSTRAYKVGDREIRASSMRDITERKRAEQALQESQKFLQTVMDNIPQSIFWKDSNLTYLGCNSAFAMDAGIASPSDIPGKTDWDMPWKEQAELYRADDSLVMKSGVPKLNYEEPQTNPQGQTTWLRTSKIPLYDGDGNVTAVLGMYEDITERKQAEAELQQEKDLSDAIINSLPGVFYMFDTSGRFVRWNKNYEKMLGMTTEEVANSDPSTGVAEEDLPALNAAIEKTLTENIPASAEATIVSQRGERIPYYFTGNSVTLGDQVYVLGVGQDITERKQTEAQLQQEKSLSDAIINGLPGTFYLFDLQGRMIRWNKQYEQVSGYTAEEIPTMSVIDTLAEEDRESALATIQRAMMEGQGAVEANFITKDGRRIPYYFAGQRLQIDDQVYMAGTGMDLTERKQAEAELQREKTLSDAIINGLPGAFYLFDTQGRMIRWNKQYEQVLGYTAEETAARTALDPIAEDDKERVMNAIQHVFTEGQARVEADFVTKDGRHIPYYFAGQLLNLGDQVYLAGTGIDITERRQLEEGLLLRDRALASSLNAVLIAGLDFKPIYVNDSLLNMTGYTHEEAMQLAVTDLTGDPEGLKRIDEATHTQGFFVGEEPIKRKDGSIFPANFSTSYITNAEGKPIAIQTSFTDITERKRLEAQVREAFERRGLQVELSTRVSQSIAAASNLGELYERVVTQVKEQFGYYHTQLLRYDPAQEAVVLVTGYGETGAKMLAAGHRLPMGEGLIGTAAADGETVLRPALENDPDWHPNPLLPETKGEIAVPIKLGDTILGVLDVQSSVAGALDADDQLLLEGLCGQIAIAIESTRLREDMSERLEEINRLYRAMSREGWQTYRETADVASGFVYDQAGLRPTQDVTLAEELFATVPLTVPGGEVIGNLAIADDPQRPLSAEDESFLQQVSEQVALALESARLFEQTQSALATIQESQAALNEVMSVAGMANWSLNLETFVFTYNDRLYQMLGTTAEEEGGYQMSAEKYVGTYIHPDDAGLIMGAIQEGIQSPDPQNFKGSLEYRMIRKDGEIRYMLTDYRLIVNTEGRPVAGVGSFLDITQRKKAELAVQESEQRYQQILDAITDMVLVKGHKSSIVWANRSFRDYYGMSNEQLQGMIDAPIVEPDYTLQYVKDDAHVFETGNILSIPEEPVTRHDGVVLPFETVKAPIRDIDGKIVMTVGVSRDITERKRVQEALAKQAAELETVAQVSTTASKVLDPDQLLQAVVDLTKERFGLYHAHIYTFDESWNTLLLAAGAGEVGRKLVAEEHAIPLTLEQSLVARAARERKHIIVNDVNKEPGFLPNPLLPETCAEMAIPMTVGDKLLGVFDVQSSNPAGFSDRDANIYVTLAAQVGVALQNARSYAEQAALVTQLRELDRLKSSFLANMSHELRTPLNSILGFADVIIEELDGPLTENMTNDLRLIQKNGQHLLHLINDVLDMAKIEAGRMNLNPEKFTAFEVIEEVTSITSTLASEKNLALFIEPDSDQNVKIFADRTRLRQVMINLVNNAIKFTENGKISLKLAALEGARVLFTIKDTGIGIPPDKLDAIFQEFTQVDSSTTRKAGGTGLGLPISRRLVEMHGGRLWAESTGVSGEGSTFFVELPVEARITETVEKQAK